MSPPLLPSFSGLPKTSPTQSREEWIESIENPSFPDVERTLAILCSSDSLSSYPSWRPQRAAAHPRQQQDRTPKQPPRPQLTNTLPQALLHAQYRKLPVVFSYHASHHSDENNVGESRRRLDPCLPFTDPDLALSALQGQSIRMGISAKEEGDVRAKWRARELETKKTFFQRNGILSMEERVKVSADWRDEDLERTWRRNVEGAFAEVDAAARRDARERQKRQQEEEEEEEEERLERSPKRYAWRSRGSEDMRRNRHADEKASFGSTSAAAVQDEYEMEDILSPTPTDRRVESLPQRLEDMVSLQSSGQDGAADGDGGNGGHDAGTLELDLPRILTGIATPEEYHEQGVPGEA